MLICSTARGDDQTADRFLASLARLVARSRRSKEVEIIVLRHELMVLRRQLDRPALSPRRYPGRDAMGGWSHLKRCCAGIANASPDIGHSPPRSPGRPSTATEIRRLIIEMATQNPTWGYRRIHGELAGLGHHLGASTVWKILKRQGIDPAPGRSTVNWTQFLRSQAAVACDFACIDSALFLRHADHLADTAALVRDRGSQFTSSFDKIFRSEHMKILKTSVRTPVANSFAERWMGTLRRELLDRTIIWNRHQLERLVIDYIDHYNAHRPHRSLNQHPPRTDRASIPNAPPTPLRVVKSTRCDGLINEYRNGA